MTADADRQRYDGLLAEMAQRQPPVVIRLKTTSALQTFIDRALRVLTLGGQDRYLTDYVTTLGATIWVPATWEDWSHRARYKVLRHELVHVRQFERFTWPGMVLIYGFFPLPAGLAWGRAMLEWEAYAVTLEVEAEVDGPEAARAPELHDEIVRRFTGPDYGWMWPFEGWVRRRIARTLAAMSRREPLP
ncbi:MAG: hypothetical protein Q8S73_40600 [Deltaproteobacteria bacterium]|nr:hypothetical protein [Myxococcales bacterium]MDP3220463.1 hypothetical protein [Deltaproteobacteria bacterium]